MLSSLIGLTRECKLCASGFVIPEVLKNYATTHCEQCVKIKRKEAKQRYKSANPAKVKEQAKKQNRKQWEKAKNDPVLMAVRKAKFDTWRSKNIDRLRENQKKWKVNNKDKYLAKTKEWRKTKDIEYFRELSRKSYDKLKAETLERRGIYRSQGRYRHFKLLRTARKTQAAGWTNRRLMDEKLAYYGGRCRYCGIELDMAILSFDHAIPLSRGGSNWTANLLPCCRRCNSKKNKKTFFEYTGRA